MSTARARAGAATIHNTLYITGGYNRDDTLCSAECFDTTAEQWIPLAQMTHARLSPGVCALHGQLYAIGGEDDGTSSEVYNPKNDTWTQTNPPNNPTNRGDMVLVTLNTAAIVLGLGPQYNKCEKFSPSTGSWTELPDMPLGRTAFAAVAMANKLYVLAGNSKD